MSKTNRPHEFKPPEEKAGRSRLFWLALVSSLAYWSWQRWRHRGDEDDPVDPGDLERGHRPSSDTSEMRVAVFGGVLLLMLALIFSAVWLLIGIVGGRDTPGERGPFALDREGPELQSDPAIALMEVRNREDYLLNGYGWVDREAGVVRIPIERAMALVADGAEDVPVPDTIRMLTESGIVDVAIGVPAGASPPYLGMSPEPTAVNAEIAEILGLIRTSSPESLQTEREPDP